MKRPVLILLIFGGLLSVLTTAALAGDPWNAENRIWGRFNTFTKFLESHRTGHVFCDSYPQVGVAKEADDSDVVFQSTMLESFKNGSSDPSDDVDVTIIQSPSEHLRAAYVTVNGVAVFSGPVTPREAALAASAVWEYCFSAGTID